MINPVQIIRLFQINLILMRHTFRPDVVGVYSPFLKYLSYLNPLSITTKKKSRGEAIRLALQNLGPIFVKFGQLLSTRRDLLPDDIADELAKLQDQVPPFPGHLAQQKIEKSLKKSIAEIFSEFSLTPLASASIAQVHAAKLFDGADVVVKVLRPKITKIIRRDVAILYWVARLSARFWKHGKRLKPIALVAEFERTILDELDLRYEAANASQLRNNFLTSSMMYVPKIFWDYSSQQVLVMERIFGIPIADLAALHTANVNMKRLAEYGVEIFFTQVFRDSFFHADMHPGNLFVDATQPEHPKYLGVDFGIMGTLSPNDQHYLAQNLVAFFNRDYRRIALLHIESGWVPPQTRVDLFEAAIRTVSEPIFEKPLKEISFGQLLLRLFQTAERFEMEIQPQLMLLQKTLLAIEGLGRQLYPDLNLWETAKPFLTRWVRQQRGIKKLAFFTKNNWPEIAEKMLQTPVLLHQVLENINQRQLERNYYRTLRRVTGGWSRNLLFFFCGVLLTLILFIIF